MIAEGHAKDLHLTLVIALNAALSFMGVELG